MEPRFEVKYLCSHKMFAEFGRKYMVGPRTPVLVVFWVAYAVLLAICLLGTPDHESLSMVIALGFLYLVFAFMPHWHAWLTRRQTKKQNDGILPETVVTFGETIEVHEGMVHITVEYRKLVAVHRLKYSYVLMIGKRNGVMLDPNSFTKGTFAEFKQFLREKRPDLCVPE